MESHPDADRRAKVLYPTSGLPTKQLALRGPKGLKFTVWLDSLMNCKFALYCTVCTTKAPNKSNDRAFTVAPAFSHNLEPPSWALSSNLALRLLFKGKCCHVLRECPISDGKCRQLKQ